MSSRFDDCGRTKPDAKCTVASSGRERERKRVTLVSCLTCRWLTAGLAFFAVLFCPGVLSSQTAPDQDLTSLSIEDLAKVKVFSASRHLEESRQAPSGVSIITKEEITRYGWRTLADVLNSLRGFYTAYDRNYAYVGVRGFLRPGDYNSRILLLINGHRVNDNVYDSAFIGTEFPLDLDLVDRIEIVRGPSSSLFGTNAVFGVINVITRKADAGAMAEVTGDSSSFLGRKGRLTTSFQKGRLATLVSGSLFRSAGQSQLFYPEFASPETNNGFARNIDGDSSAQVFSDLQYGNFRVQGLYSSRMKIVPTASYETNFNDPGTRTTDTRGYVDVAYHRSISSLTDLDLRTYYDAYRYYGTYAYGGTNSPDRYLNFDSSEADWVGVEAIVGHQVGRHRITVGADYEHNLRVDQLNYDAGQPPVVDDHSAPWRAAAFGEAELNLVPKLTVRAGGRVDYFHDFGEAFSPRVALVYSPSSRTALKYIFGRAFRAPNAYESYYQDNVVIEAPGVQLQPEHLTSHEVIVEHSPTSWLRTTADGFYDHLRNLIDQIPDPATGLTYFSNVGHDRGRGVEFELEAKRASGLSGRASYAFADAYNLIDRKPLENSPTHNAKLNATIPVPRQALVGLELLYFSAQKSYQGTPVPSSFLTNVTLSTKSLWGGWEFSASCYNLFDHRWFSPAPPGLRQAEIQQDGRTYRFKITYGFHRERK
jgi:outer membrane receptor for ferrienterochelin and colicins